MSVIGAIPARWGSTRLPGKSLLPICGKPLIQWVIEGVRRARRLDIVVVATDDRRIADVAEGLGVRAVMTRPDHPSGTDRIAEAIRDIPGEIVINVQGDEPLIEPALIDRIAEAMETDTRWDMATAASRITREEDRANPAVVKVVLGERGQALYFSRSVIPHVRDGGADGGDVTHWRHLGIYAYRRVFLERLVGAPPCMLERAEKLEQLRALYLGARMLVVETEARGKGIDTPADVPYVEALIRGR